MVGGTLTLSCLPVLFTQLFEGLLKEQKTKALVLNHVGTMQVRNTVNTGRTVVCTIHQPSIEIFEVRSMLIAQHPVFWRMLETRRARHDTTQCDASMGMKFMA